MGGISPSSWDGVVADMVFVVEVQRSTFNVQRLIY